MAFVSSLSLFRSLSFVCLYFCLSLFVSFTLQIFSFILFLLLSIFFLLSLCVLPVIIIHFLCFFLFLLFLNICLICLNIFLRFFPSLFFICYLTYI